MKKIFILVHFLFLCRSMCHEMAYFTLPHRCSQFFTLLSYLFPKSLYLERQSPAFHNHKSWRYLDTAARFFYTEAKMKRISQCGRPCRQAGRFPLHNGMLKNIPKREGKKEAAASPAESRSCGYPLQKSREGRVFWHRHTVMPAQDCTRRILTCLATARPTLLTLLRSWTF